jgi:hypothetical protein
MKAVEKLLKHKYSRKFGDKWDRVAKQFDYYDMIEFAEAFAAEKETEIRAAVADLWAAKGCSCCADHDGLERANETLGKLLNVARYDDDSGYDFWQYRKGGKDGNVQQD